VAERAFRRWGDLFIPSEDENSTAYVRMLNDIANRTASPPQFVRARIIADGATMIVDGETVYVLAGRPAGRIERLWRALADKFFPRRS